MTAFLSSIVESLSGDATASSDNGASSVTNNDSIEEIESLLDCGKRLVLGDEPLHILVEVVGATGLIHPSLGSKARGSGRNLLQEASETSIADTSVAAQEAENTNPNNTTKLVNAYQIPLLPITTVINSQYWSAMKRRGLRGIRLLGASRLILTLYSHIATSNV